MTTPRSPQDQIATFRIYPEPRASRLYYQVLVFTNVQAIRRYLRRSAYPDRRLGRHGVALCSNYEIRRLSSRGRFKPLPVCGEILFPRRRLRAGVIAHECAHAALGWARRIGLNVVQEPKARPRRGGTCVSDAEERFCYALGELNRQVAIQVWDRQLDTLPAAHPRR